MLQMVPPLGLCMTTTRPVKKIAWEEVAEQQASMLIWNRRHPRQQPLDTPTPCTITACIQGSTALSHQSKDSGADGANASFIASSRLPSSPRQGAQDVCLPTSSNDPDAQNVHLQHEEPDVVTSVSSPAALDAHVVHNEEPNAAAHLSPVDTCPSLPLERLPAAKPAPPSVSRSPPSPPPITGHAVAQDQSRKQPQAAKPAASATAHTWNAAMPLPAESAFISRASSAAQHHHSNIKLPTTSKASAAATGASVAVAAGGSARTKAKCRARAVATSGPPQTKSRAGAVAANDPSKSKAKRRAGAIASIGPIQSKTNNTAWAVAASGSVNTKPDSKAGSASAAIRKPSAAEGRSALSAIQEGELSGQRDQWRAGVVHAFAAS